MPDSVHPARSRYLAASSDRIPDNGRLVVDIGESTVGIFRVGGRLFAYTNTCPHMADV